MDTQHLKAFLTVAQLSSFTLAAEQLHLTQPAISKRIASLEQQLNCKLFDRIGRDIHLTEAGRALLPRARTILQTVKDTEQALSNLSGHISGTLKLATSHHIGLHHLPQVLKYFTREHPEVVLELEFLDSEKAYSAVQRGEVELAMITLSPEDTDNTTATVLWPDPLAFVAAPDHPLTNEPNCELKNLSQYPAILPDPLTYTTQLIRKRFDAKRLPLQTTMATNYLETIKMLVSIGLGWSALPRTMLDEQLRELKIPGQSLQRNLGSIHHSARTLSNAAEAFLGALKQQPATLAG
ncbi:LysR family transcriptional regulator [Pseudomaricurvus alkylphenolicus]|jgi:DNA-binding transcriptional LysR family regulator|uniref:LysR family transcriptional regulator n=1 Tax=Pseudomaricurvus alkylphenolicus TaxID=1306991 RepID=UPI00142269BE|nr:LysR family transcriptional regulator [Pseudomaricurvus alkylphenolicus]NIB41338.1 LysR family transcriptional regulator [Pseudomaricurvus alkylphenolicus]